MAVGTYKLTRVNFDNIFAANLAKLATSVASLTKIFKWPVAFNAALYSKCFSSQNETNLCKYFHRSKFQHEFQHECEYYFSDGCLCVSALRLFPGTA